MTKLLIATFATLVSFQGYAEEYPGLKVGEAAFNVPVAQIETNNTEVTKELLNVNKSNQTILLEFATTTCPACLGNLPVLSKLSQEIAETTTTRLILVDKDATASKEFIAEKRELLVFDVAVDSTRVAWKPYSTGYVPTSYIIKNGVIIWKHVGSYDDEIIEQIKELVK